VKSPKRSACCSRRRPSARAVAAEDVEIRGERDAVTRAAQPRRKRGEVWPASQTIQMTLTAPRQQLEWERESLPMTKGPEFHPMSFPHLAAILST
jgi:hypothetical protein